MKLGTFAPLKGTRIPDLTSVVVGPVATWRLGQYGAEIINVESPEGEPVKTADGWISFTTNTDSQVRAFLKAVGRRDLLDDPRFGTVAARATNVAEWFAVRGAPLTGKATLEWLEILRAADIAAMPCHTLESLPRDPLLASVDLVQFEAHPIEGKAAAIRSSLKFDDGYPALGCPSQPRGWETREILKEIGYSTADVEGFLSSRAATSA